MTLLIGVLLSPYNLRMQTDPQTSVRLLMRLPSKCDATVLRDNQLNAQKCFSAGAYRNPGFLLSAPYVLAANRRCRNGDTQTVSLLQLDKRAQIGAPRCLGAPVS